MKDLLLPAFEMDCRDWLVATPGEAGLPDELAGSPLLAVLSTVVLADGCFRPASGVLTVGLLDEGAPTSHPIAPGCVASELVESDEDSDAEVRRYVLPAPGRRLALLAEFSMPEGPDREVLGRIVSLMTSFRWAG